MRILGNGVDIVENRRIEKAIKNENVERLENHPKQLKN